MLGVPAAELTRVGIQTYQGAGVQGSREGERGPTEVKQLDVDVLSLRDSITLTTECRPTGRLALRISGIGTSETYSSLREPLLRLLLKSGTAFYIMSRTTFKSGTAIAMSAE